MYFWRYKKKCTACFTHELKCPRHGTVNSPFILFTYCNENPYTRKETRAVLLHLSQVSSCSVLINMKNDVLNCAVFTTAFEFKIGFSGVKKNSLLSWQQFSYDLNNGHFRTSPVDVFLNANLSWGSKFFISHFV